MAKIHLFSARKTLKKLKFSKTMGKKRQLQEKDVNIFQRLFQNHFLNRGRTLPAGGHKARFETFKWPRIKKCTFAAFLLKQSKPHVQHLTGKNK